MNSIDFCFWLQGYFEISGSSEISREQANVIKNHLNLVFTHEIDPLRDGQTTATPQNLSHAHLGNSGNDTKIRC